MATCPGCDAAIDEICYWAAHMVRHDITAEGINSDDYYVGEQPEDAQETWECPKCGHDFGSEEAAVTFLNSGANPTPRRRRPENIKPLRDVVVDVLSRLGRADLKAIVAAVLSTGFKTNSKKFGNTCRVQLFRLDDDGAVVSHDDGTFELKPRYLRSRGQ